MTAMPKKDAMASATKEINDIDVSLRTRATQIRYSHDVRSGSTQRLQDKVSLREWRYWRLVTNDYPYDAVFKKHDMLLVKRLDASERFDLTPQERQEFDDILRSFVYPNYSLWFENCPKTRSVPLLYHVHLAAYHDSRADMRF